MASASGSIPKDSLKNDRSLQDVWTALSVVGLQDSYLLCLQMHDSYRGETTQKRVTPYPRIPSFSEPSSTFSLSLLSWKSRPHRRRRMRGRCCGGGCCCGCVWVWVCGRCVVTCRLRRLRRMRRCTLIYIWITSTTKPNLNKPTNNATSTPTPIGAKDPPTPTAAP